jgi:hypothetical protein
MNEVGKQQRERNLCVTGYMSVLRVLSEESGEKADEASDERAPYKIAEYPLQFI